MNPHSLYGSNYTININLNININIKILNDGGFLGFKLAL
jgi:hypothetical protein